MGCGETEIEVQSDGMVVMTIDCEDCDFFPSIENEPKMMALVLERMLGEGAPTLIRIRQVREYEYDSAATQVLSQVAQVSQSLRESLSKLHPAKHAECADFFAGRVGRLQDLFRAEMLLDPVGAYVSLVRMRNEDHALFREQKIAKM